MPQPATTLRFSAAGTTDVGRQRDHNEDHLLVHPGLGLFVVADGMGGNNAGEVASALVTSSIKNFFEATVATPADAPRAAKERNLSPAAERLVASIEKANADVFEISNSMREHRGMGSTVVAAYLPPQCQSANIFVAHVGDSRCYRFRAGEVEQLTRDHSLVSDALRWNPKLTKEELSRLPKNIISRALGLRATVEVDILVEDARAGDVYLLCSDGLSGMVGGAQMLELVQLMDRLDEACDLLVQLANEAGGEDNITALLIRVDGAGPVIEGTDSAAPEIVCAPMLEDQAKALLQDIGEPSGLADAPAPDGGVDTRPDASAIRRCRACGCTTAAGHSFCSQCGGRV